LATLEQMAKRCITVTTRSGVKYQLPRPSIALRFDAVKFVELAGRFEGDAGENPETMREFLKTFVEFMEKWLKRHSPDITQEQIMEDWDVTDIPAIMNVINGFEEEVQAAIPPEPASRKAKKK
jgi:hypothetical protein